MLSFLSALLYSQLFSNFVGERIILKCQSILILVILVLMGE